MISGDSSLPDVQMKLKALEAVYEVSSFVASSTHPDLPRIFNLVLGKALALTGSKYGTLQLCNPESQELELVAAVGVAESNRSFKQKVSEGVVGQAARERTTIVISDISEIQYYVALIPDMKSELAVPMMYRGRLLGVVNLESAMERAYDVDDERIVELFASQVAIAMAQAELLNQTSENLQPRVQELQHLHKIGEAINPALDLSKTLTTVLDSGLSLIGCETPGTMYQKRAK